jgi:hypothetical protein
LLFKACKLAIRESIMADIEREKKRSENADGMVRKYFEAM